ncbi:hypothetical protein BS47DRAFT_1363256 [Hydnum rufescens UP504]|uniref:CxC2-like cysteine cluster KDZ transposase-associated domain-containing protein n=1 Tax=Hydnum rufescens UP504 TaxID=1448309 RepID=A0A9P6AV36_9AGAM|nr:hypothetical protein BS47DRAFT_1363256 [Hydnum rufescens UP504]
MHKWKNCPWTTVMRNYNGRTSTCVEHIVPRVGAPSTSSTHTVLIPKSLETRGEVPYHSDLQSTELGLFDGHQDDETLGTVHYIGAPHPCKHYQAVDKLLKTWIPYRDDFLDAMLWHEGHGDALMTLGCPDCKTPGESSVYCCKECFFDKLVCKSGILTTSQQWSGQQFEPSVQSKVSTIHFYQALERETDNSGLMDIKSRYSSFLHMVCIWRHLKLLKQGGCGHDPLGAEGMRRGELALVCPACPIPSMNLPDR